MEARGYRGGQGRTKMRDLAYTGKDFAAMALLLVMVAAVSYLRFAGLG
jgi:energy-coupling factor transport system permease protein